MSKLEVTQNHIDDSLCGSPWSCAVAHALLDQHPLKRGFVYMVGFGIQVRDSFLSPRASMKSPRELRLFICAYDRDKRSVKPTTFDIDLSPFNDFLVTPV